jgi:hypothetical protein
MKHLLILSLLLPSLAFAWGETGHRVVCQIAYEELLPDARAELNRLLDQDANYDSFAESCLFADSPQRIREQDHFINMPRSTKAITSNDCPMAESCVLPAIRNDVFVLQDSSSTDADKWHAIKLLGHWVGDVHQPMHVAFQDDRGSNSNIAEASVEMKYPNLHAVWDYLIISSTLGDDYQEISGRLQTRISDEQRQAWKYDSPIEWANESFQITIAPTTKYCVQQQGACWYRRNNMLLDKGEDWRSIAISDDYLEDHSEVVILRLQKAGVRLARILNQSLGETESE